MRHLFVSTLFICALAACGGGGGGTKPTPDGGISLIDAGGDINVPSWASGLCNAETPCADVGSDCIAITANAVNGFCTPVCFDGADPAQPTETHHMGCANAYTGTVGDTTQVGCVVGPADGDTQWHCIVICMVEADCPETLTCTPVGDGTVSACI
jgi:hypothetical protein